MKKRFMNILVCLFFLLSLSGTAFAVNSSAVDLASGVVLSDTVTGIEDTGENLVGPSANNVMDASVLTDDVIITTATVQNDEINLIGTVNGIPFNVSGAFCSISENGNVVVFNGVDSANNFRVVYCAIEKELDKASLYFDAYAFRNSGYDVVTKLYLAPNSDVDGEYIIAELYGNEFPSISREAISELPEDHQLNLFWYAREFKPVDISTEQEETYMTRADSISYGQLESYTFNHLGMKITHYMRHWQDCNIRDVSGNSASIASATFRISEKWVEAPLENDCSDTTSTLSLKNVSIVYLTRPNTAVDLIHAAGKVTQSGRVVTSFKLGFGVGLKGISSIASLNFTWEPGNDDLSTGVDHALHTNSPGGDYWREAEAKLKSNQSLNSIGNEFVVTWSYSGYNATPSTENASLVFKYYVDNLLDYAAGHAEIDEREIPVVIT